MRLLFWFMLFPLAVVLLTGACVARLHGPWHTITRDNVAEIHIGMTEKEVEAILGAPGRTKTRDVFPVSSWMSGEIGTFAKVWASDKVGVICYFDETGKVCSIIPAGVLPQDWFPDNVLRDLGLKPRRSWPSFAYIY